MFADLFTGYFTIIRCGENSDSQPKISRAELPNTRSHAPVNVLTGAVHFIEAVCLSFA